MLNSPPALPIGFPGHESSLSHRDAFIHFTQCSDTVPVYDRNSFTAGHKLTGPALIANDYITVLLTDEYSLHVDDLLNLILERNENSRC